MPYNASYDYARLIAAFGIVVFHAQAPGDQIGYAALPFFLMLMILFALPGAAVQGAGAYARGRWRRLMRPFVIWSAVYGGLKLVEIGLTQATFGSEFAPHMLLTGPAIHLWFLPFAFVACLLIHPLARLGRSAWIWALGLTALALGLQAASQGQALTTPLAQWTYVAPAACLGMALALMRGSPRVQAWLVAGFVSLASLMGWANGLEQLALAAVALLACGVITLPRSRASDIAAQTAMGIYLAHPLVFSLLERATPLTKSTLLFAALATLLAWGLSLAWPHIGAMGRTQSRQAARP